MRASKSAAASILIFGCSASALGQVNPSIIGNTIGQIMTPGRMPDSCYDGTARVSAKAIQKVTPYIDKTIQKYRERALGAEGIKTAFMKHGRFVVDGVEIDPGSAQDPWLDPTVQLVRSEDFVRATAGGFVLARWKAIAGDGRVIGTYDGFMAPRPREFGFRELKLYTAGTPQPEALKPFCVTPGDVELWREAKAKRGAEKASKKARNQEAATK